MKTSDFARLMNVQTDSVRTALYRNGNYMGVRPRRLPNGRLDWPDEEVLKVCEARPSSPREPHESIPILPSRERHGQSAG